MASECGNEETADIVETEAADSDNKTKSVSIASELIPSHNAVSAIWQVFSCKPRLIIKPGMIQFAGESTAYDSQGRIFAEVVYDS